MRMDEFREIVDLPPVLLQRQDLFELERLLMDDVGHNANYSLTFKVTDGPRRISAESIDRLFEKDLPHSTDSFNADVLSRSSSNEIDAGISLTLYHNFGQFQLFAHSEPTFLGKKHQLLEFFRRHRPWYAVLIRLIPFAAPALFFTALFASALLLNQGQLLPALLAFVLSLTTAVLTWLSFTNRIFPYVRVVLEEPSRRPAGWELAILILEVSALIATILSIVLPVLR